MQSTTSSARIARQRRRLFVMANILLTALLTACADGILDPPPQQPEASVEVAPRAHTLTVGESYGLDVTVKDASGAPLHGRAIAWQSSNAAVATVSAAGLVTALAPGHATVTVSSEGKRDSASITVTAVPPPPVASVQVSPATAEIQEGQTFQLTVLLKDAAGHPLQGRAVAWSSSNTAVLTVSAGGLVSAVAIGTATVTAVSEGKQDSARITVIHGTSTGPVERVELNLTSAEPEEGDAVQLEATPRDAQGRPVPGLAVQWTSSDPGIAYVTAGGNVYAIRHGTATVTARVHGRTATATIAVRANYAYELVYSAAGTAMPSRSYVLDLAGGEPRLVVPEGLFPREWSIGGVEPSPDGTRIAFMVVNPGGSSIYVANRDGTGAYFLARGGKPVWSPDGQQIAYQQRVAESYDDIMVINVNGTGQLNLTADQGEWDQQWPTWSPRQTDGSYRIAYAHIEAGRPNIWTMKSDGTDKRQLTNTGMDMQPAWSPDGSAIAFQRSGVGTGANLWLISASGDNERSLQLPLVQRTPSWSPDGRLIAFVSSHATGADEVYTVWSNLAGISVARRTSDDLFKGSPSWMKR